MALEEEGGEIGFFLLFPSKVTFPHDSLPLSFSPHFSTRSSSIVFPLLSSSCVCYRPPLHEQCRRDIRALFSLSPSLSRLLLQIGGDKIGPVYPHTHSISSFVYPRRGRGGRRSQQRTFGRRRRRQAGKAEGMGPSQGRKRRRETRKHRRHERTNERKRVREIEK